MPCKNDKTSLLKEKNSTILAFLLAANVAVYFANLRFGLVLEEWWNAIINVKTIAPILTVTVFAGVLNSQLGAITKARIVFWRWKNPLPASRAFSRYLHEDERIEAAAILRFRRHLPTEPAAQNSLWYKWYQEFRNEPAVLQAHKNYLLYRDYAGLAFLLALALGPLSVWYVSSIPAATAYIAFLVAQFVLVCRAAQNHGIRFVTTVLAHKSAQS